MVATKLSVRYPEFGKRVRARAEEKNISIADIQHGLKVTYEMARRYWEGIAKPREPKMRKLADLIGAKVAWLEYGEADAGEARERAAAYAGTAQLNEEARELAMAFQLLTPVQREFYKGQIFRDAALGRVAPWLKAGRPAGDSYSRYERSMERDIEKRVRQLQLNLETK
jgi:transcriptional regulator with XRE-family HTH domain